VQHSAVGSTGQRETGNSTSAAVNRAVDNASGKGETWLVRDTATRRAKKARLPGRKTTGGRLAAKARKLASKLTPEEEAEHFRRGMAKIYGGQPKEITGVWTLIFCSTSPGRRILPTSSRRNFPGGAIPCLCRRRWSRNWSFSLAERRAAARNRQCGSGKNERFWESQPFTLSSTQLAIATQFASALDGVFTHSRNRTERREDSGASITGGNSPAGDF